MRMQCSTGDVPTRLKSYSSVSSVSTFIFVGCFCVFPFFRVTAPYLFMPPTKDSDNKGRKGKMVTQANTTECSKLSTGLCSACFDNVRMEGVADNRQAAAKRFLVHKAATLPLCS